MSAYIPILVAEGARLAGLAATSPATKNRLTPLFEAPALDPPVTPAPDASAIEARLATVLDAVAAAFGPRRAYLDCAALDPVRVGDGRLAAAWLFDEARARGLPFVPVTGLRATDAHQLAAADAASVDGRGACLRLQLPDFADLDALPERVHALVDLLGLAPERVDLLIDLGRVTAEEPRVLAVAARGVLSPLRRTARWRSVAVAAAGPAPNGAPDGAGGAPAPRAEWRLWRALAADAPALGFGDYAGLGADAARLADRGPAPAPAPAGAPADRGAPRTYAPAGSWSFVHARDDHARDEPAPGPDQPARPGGPPLAGRADRPTAYHDTRQAGEGGPVAVRAAERHPADAAPAPTPPHGGTPGALHRAAAVADHLTATAEGVARADRDPARPDPRAAG